MENMKMELSEVKNFYDNLLKKQVPLRYQDCSFKNYNGNLRAKHSLKDYKYDNIAYIAGDVGTGKTHLSIALLRQLTEKLSQKRDLVEKNFKYITLPGLLVESMDCQQAKIIKKYTEKNMVALVIDDISAVNITGYAKAMFFEIINIRYSEMLGTILTGNFGMENIVKNFGRALASRISSGMVVELNGRDNRKK